jgi:predicted Zn-dependent protease
MTLGAIWLVTTWRSIRDLPNLCKPAEGSPDEGLFIQAQGEYLKGHWFEAERLALQRVAVHPSDVESQLLLAAIYRRMKRLDEARRRLQAVARYDGSQKWGLEVSLEKRWLDQLEEELESVAEKPPETMNQAA